MNVFAASVRAIVADVPGNVIVVLSVPDKVRLFEMVRTFDPVTVSVPVVVVIVRPLTDVGAIAPAMIVMAGVVVALATVPENPFAVATDTVVTVPDPHTVCHVGSTPAPFDVSTCPEFPTPETC